MVIAKEAGAPEAPTTVAVSCVAAGGAAKAKGPAVSNTAEQPVMQVAGELRSAEAGTAAATAAAARASARIGRRSILTDSARR